MSKNITIEIAIENDRTWEEAEGPMTVALHEAFGEENVTITEAD